MTFSRRDFVRSGALAALLAAMPGAHLPLRAAVPAIRRFPQGFLWGAATSGHQSEGDNTASDIWWLEHVKPTSFAEPSGSAVGSFGHWRDDLDLVQSLGLNTYRFSLEWSRIEPEEGQFSPGMLDHYRRLIDGCRERGLTPVVTFNHFSCPRWFAARGGWANAAAPDLFARYCERAAQALSQGMAYALTLNEPNLPSILAWIGLPPPVYEAHAAMLKAAAASLASPTFSAGFLLSREQFRPMIPILGEAHRKGRAAIKSVRPDLPVGLSLAVSDDQAVGRASLRDAKRAEAYAPWFATAADDDFIGVQNYDRSRIDAKGQLPAPPGAVLNQMGAEVYAPSLGGAVRYVHQATGKPIMVTEHGVGTAEDSVRARLIPEALAGLHHAMAEGAQVLGYIHWSLLDNYEWYSGFGSNFGLASVDRKTFVRTARPSAWVLAEIARANAIGAVSKLNSK